MADTVTKEAAAAEAAALVETATKTEQERAAGIIEACVKADVMAMASPLIKEGVTIEQAQARIDGAKDIKAAVALARKSCPQIDATLADQFIAAGKTIDKVRAELFEKISAVEAAKPTRSAHQAKTGGDEIDNATALWDKQVDKVNARQKAA